MSEVIFSFHLFATWALVGLIWTVQILVYPQFHHVGAQEWGGYHRNHMASISWVVVPLMGVEVLSAFWLALHPPAGLSSLWFWWGGVGAVGAIWGVTAFVSVPLHQKLNSGFGSELVSSLVSTHWVRTWLWTARGLFVWVSLLVMMGIIPAA